MSDKLINVPELEWYFEVHEIIIVGPLLAFY